METGFGMGISATFLQKHTGIKEHVVIEANKGVFASKLLPFATNYSSVRPMYGFFQDVTPMLQSNSFDAVLYDTFPMDDDDISNPLCIHHRKIMKEVYRMLKVGGVFTYFANMNTKEGDIRALQLAGFKKEDIHIDSFKMYDMIGDCKTYPHCKKVKAHFQVPRIVKSSPQQ